MFFNCSKQFLDRLSNIFIIYANKSEKNQNDVNIDILSQFY